MENDKIPPGMDAERWKRIETIFDEAMSLPPEERSAWLDRTCAEEPAAKELASLLTADAKFPSLPTAPAGGDDVVLTDTEVDDPDVGAGEGRRIGRYRLLQELGEGGMGVVYLADQETPIRRRVALKLVKLGMDTKAVIGRFEAERQALALMSHPNVAKVLDAGATEQGRPYFVMEYVKGVSITDHCDRHRLTNKERLQLFMQVCEGVQHAHRKGIIHRDLKPSNVLVAIEADKAVPKIIDFGVAKATEYRLSEQTVFTRLGQLIGTPEYMSPEQAEMTRQDIDTRTDVYSLGVILYELLVGALPFASRELRRAGFDEIRRKIREDEPSKPSTRISTLGDVSSDSARNRRTDPVSLVAQLRGDLDWITMKALEKNRARRYGSPSELSAEIQRHLGHEPVLAGPPGLVYRMRKFTQRHRVGVMASLVVLLAVVLVAAAGTVGWVRVLRAEATATQETDRAERLSNFLAVPVQGRDRIVYVKPEYPLPAKNAGVEGQVLLQVLIGEDGAVEHVEVLQCNQPNMGFEEAAANAARRWRYEPATEGDPGKAQMTLRLDFDLP